MSPLTQRSLLTDVMRGLTLALMIVVNMAIDDTRSYAQLLHARWHGFTLTDAVFPSFLFAVGLSIALSIDRQRASGSADFHRRLLTRALALFVIGYLLSSAPFLRYDAASGVWSLLPLSQTRILGVLQRIALTYAAGALIFQRFGTPGAWVGIGISLLSYAVLLTVTGDLSLLGNGPRQLDLWLFGESHLYMGEGVPFDPEGLLSTLPAIANVLAGCLAGRWFKERGYTRASLGRWGAIAGAALVLGLAWAQVLPLNKKLWTSSYALVMIGVDGLVLVLLAYLVERRGFRMASEFFATLGRNTLAVYVFSELGNLALSSTRIDSMSTFEWIHAQLFAPWAGAKFGSLLYSLAYLLVCWGFAFELGRRRLYLRA
jgi:predicted acyltransferase